MPTVEVSEMTSRRRSDPVSTTYSAYPTSPTVSRDSRATRVSSLFEYSTPRPRTAHSSSWVPPVPRRRPVSERSEVSSSVSDGIGGDGETPLYARSDWDEDDDQDGLRTETSAYSRSSLGMTTAPLGTGMRGNTLGDIQEEDEEYMADDRNSSRTHGGGATWGGGQMVMSPSSIGDPMTARSALSYLQDSPSKARHKGPSPVSNGRSNNDRWGSGAMVNSPGEMSMSGTGSIMIPPQYGNGMTTSPGLMTPYSADGKQEHGAYHDASRDSLGKYASIRKSTLPSVLELEHLTKNMDPNRKLGSKDVDGSNPFADTTSPRLMSPAAQQRLGRMSVAPARYNSPTTPFKEKQSRDVTSPRRGSGIKIPRSAVIKTTGGLSRFYQTWRPFINPALGLVSALLLTISLQNNPGPMSRYLKVPVGAFAVSPRGVGAVGLGVNGWCPLTG